MTRVPPAQAFATVFLDELVRLGVRHVVVCPGSRSAPLAYAALAHERAGLLTVHVRVDERSAAYLALGIGKASGMPAALVTTSGTAVANAHPGVLEADESRVPMLLLTADRPHELRWARANQTTQQPGIFGPAVRAGFDLPAPAEGAGRARFWRTSADRAVGAALGVLGGPPGPVHVNLPLREPLTPLPGDGHPGDPGSSGASRGPDGGTGGDSPLERARLVDADLPRSFQGRPDGSPWTALPPPPLESPVRAGAGPLPDVPRTLLLAGSAPARVREAAAAFARRRGHVLIAEPFGSFGPVPAAGSPVSPQVPLPHGMLALETPFGWDAAHVPDRILVVGRLTLSRAAGEFLRSSGADVQVLAEDGAWPDPGHLMSQVRHWSALLDDDPGAGRGGYGRGAGHWPSGEAERFTAGWERASARLAEAVRRSVPAMWPRGPAVARELLAALPGDAWLFLGSSSLVRDVAYVRGRDQADVIANRGLAGIDGCVSTAAGLALAEPGRPGYALMGDLTLLHDASGLVTGPDEVRPDLTVVVVNDDGGAIFETLEYGSPEVAGRDPEAFRRLFATPTGTSFAALAEAHHVGYAAIEDPARLRAEVAVPPSGLRLLEVRADRGGARAQRAALVDVARQALAGL